MIEINHSKIKETNRKKIISLLMTKDEITKLEISRELNISITTVSTNIVELKNEGFVEEVRPLESTGGRKAIAFKLNENCRYSIGIALTPRHIKVVLVNIKRNIVDTIKIRHEKKDIEEIIKLIEQNISKIMDDNEVTSDTLLGIGISMPSMVDFETGVVKNAYLIGIDNFNMKKRFSYMNVPIYVDNEANLSAYYEFLNRKEDIENLLYVSITDGLGLGIIIDGNVYRGNNNISGEMGHMKIALGGKKCKCGGTGCLEAYTSKGVLLEEYNKVKNSNLVDIDEFEERINDNDVVAKDILKQYLEILSVGISNLIMILDPNSIVIGGDINNILKDNIQFIRENVYKNNLFINEKNCNINIADFKESYILGAAMMPIEDFLEIK